MFAGLSRLLFWVIPYGGEKHINKIPSNIPGQSREIFVYVFSSLCVFFVPHFLLYIFGQAPCEATAELHTLIHQGDFPPGRNYIRPPPIFGQKVFWRGGGCIFWTPPQQDFYTPPSFIRPTPRRVFSRVGGWGCIKFGPPFPLHLMPVGRIFHIFNSGCSRRRRSKCGFFLSCTREVWLAFHVLLLYPPPLRVWT